MEPVVYSRTPFANAATCEARQENLLAILDDSPDLIALADLDATLFHLNPAWRRRLGLPLQGDSPPVPLREACPAEAARLLLTDAIPLAIERGFWRGESAVLDQHRNETPVSLVLTAHRDARGNVTRFSLSARDITEEKAERGRLEHREEALRLVTESAANTIWVWDLRADTMDWSPALCRLMGVDPGRFPAPLRTLWEWIHPDDQDICARALREHLEHDTPLEMEYRMRRGDGSYAMLVTRGKSHRDERGRPLWTAGSIEDVTPRRESEAVLVRSERTYRRLVEETGGGYLVLDAQGRVLECNARFAELAGRRGPGEIAGWNAFEWLAPRDGQGDFSTQWIARGRFPRRIEVDCFRPDGTTVPLLIHAAPSRDGDGNRTLLYLLCHELGRPGPAAISR